MDCLVKGVCKGNSDMSVLEEYKKILDHASQFIPQIIYLGDSLPDAASVPTFEEEEEED